MASASVASALLLDGWAGGNAVCSRYLVVVVVVVADVCGCQPAGLGMYVSVYVRSHVAGGVRCMGSCCSSFMIATAAAGAVLVCLFVILFVVIVFFIAALAAGLCGWLICSARRGTSENDDGHGDDVTRLRVFGGACWAALAYVRLGARRACVRV